MDLLAGQKTYIGVLLAGCAIALALTPGVIRLAVRCGALDQPGARKVHTRITPRWGGLALFLGTWIPLGLLAFWRNDVTFRLSGSADELAVICLSGLSMLLLGMWDDRFGLSARWKLAVQVPVAFAVVFCGVGISRLSVPFVGPVELGAMGIALTVLWIVGVTNALNLIDGLDGLATGVAFFVAATNAIVAVYTNNDILAVVMCALAGSCLGFLRFNFAPAKIFLGDTGSLFLGMTLAVTSMAASAKSTVAASFLIPLVVLGYPVIDTLLAMARRALRGKPMFTGDRGHVHHRLIAAGLDHTRASLVLYGFCVLLSVLALGILWNNHALIGTAMLILLSVLFIGARVLGYFERFSFQRLASDRPRYQIANLSARLAQAKLKQANRPEEVFRILESLAEDFNLTRVELWKSALRLQREWSSPNGESFESAPHTEEIKVAAQREAENTGVCFTLSTASTLDDLAVEHRALLQEVAQLALERISCDAVSSQLEDQVSEPGPTPASLHLGNREAT